MSKKRNNKESMICSKLKPCQKNVKIKWSFFIANIYSDLKPVDYIIWGILENKTNTTSHPNIGSLKTAIEEEWNKMSEEFILKGCQSF